MFAIQRRFSLLILVLSLAAGSAFFGLPGRASAGGETRTVIVELKREPAAVFAARARRQGRAVTDEELQSYRSGLAAEQNQFLAALAERGVSAALASREVKNYDGGVAGAVALRYTLVLNGLALSVPSSAVPAVEAMPEVKRVHADAVLSPALNRSVNYINAPKLYGKAKELTPFDDLREGYEGQGINIAVIDSGIDWAHPMFGGDPTPPRLALAPPTPAVTSTNKKVIYYLPLADSAAYDGYGHGTHVASTAAGYLAQVPGPDRLPNTADDIRVHGVAPQAKLMSYKVCSDAGSTAGVLGCLSSTIIMALEDSVSPFTVTGQPKPVAHVINMSLGGPGGPETATAQAASNAGLAGAAVVAASGNDGPGDGTTASPAAGTHVISVGATTHPGSASLWSVDMPGHARITLNPMQGSPQPPASSVTANYVYVDSWRALGPMPAGVRGRIALVKDWLGFTFIDMATQAAAAGAVALIYIDDEGANAIKSTIPATTVTTADGQAMINALSSSDNNRPANGAVSENQVRLNRFLTDGFVGEMAGFSSRGPVAGFGQVKPDVSAPGVSVLAAVPPGSVLSALATAEYAPDQNSATRTESTAAPNYFAIDGTSMATPHTAGAVALLRQAHPGWTPDMIRTALINTSTNLRDAAGAPKADGPGTADSVIAQGGGLIDVSEAAGAKALLGVAGDGVTAPGILGSHSFGEVPVINSRVTHTAAVTVTLRDLSGQGGTYDLAVANNRDLQLAGIGVALSQSSVSVAPNGSATFRVSATVDGDLLREVMAAKTFGSRVLFERLNLQWFVTARRGDGAESLRMPFFFRPGPSVPAVPVVETDVHTDTMPAGDAGVQRDILEEFEPALDGVTYRDIPFQVDASTYRVDAKVEWFQAGETGLPDLDYQLLDPDGKVIDESGNGVGPEEVSVRVERPGTYTHRVIGYANAAQEFTVTTALYKGSAPPALRAIAGEFGDAQGRPLDFDGAFTLSWQPTGGERKFEVERSADGGQNWQLFATAEAGTTSVPVSGLTNGTYSFRVRGLHDGQVGLYVTPASAEQSVTVDRRTAADVTSLVQAVNKSVTFGGGFTDIDQALKNVSSGTTVYPTASFEITSVRSNSGQVRVSNADNGGDGRSSAAAFDYSNLLAGGDLAPGEESGAKRLRFVNQNTELFTFTAVVRGHLRDGAAGASAGGGSAGTSSVATSPGGGTSNGLQGAGQSVLTFTVNPLTRTVSLTN